MARQPAQVTWWQNSESLWLEFQVQSIKNHSMKILNNPVTGASIIKFKTDADMNNLLLSKKVELKKFKCIDKTENSLVFQMNKQSKSKGFWEQVSADDWSWFKLNTKKQAEFLNPKIELDSKSEAKMIEDEDFDINNFVYPGHIYPKIKDQTPEHQRASPNQSMMKMLKQGPSYNRYYESLEHWSHKINTERLDIMSFYRNYDISEGLRQSMVKRQYFPEMRDNKMIWYEKVINPEEFLVRAYQMRLEDDYVFGGDAHLNGIYACMAHHNDDNVDTYIFTDFAKFIKMAKLKKVLPPQFDFVKCLKFAEKHLCTATIRAEFITKTWIGKENQYNSLSGMRKVTEAIFGENYAVDVERPYEDKIRKQAKRAIYSCDGKFFEDIGGENIWFDFPDNLEFGDGVTADNFTDQFEMVQGPLDSDSVSTDSESSSEEDSECD